MKSQKDRHEEKDQLEFSCLCFDVRNECAFGDDIERFFDTLKSNVELFPSQLKITNSKEGGEALVASAADNSLSLVIRKLSNTGVLDYRVGFYIVLKFKVSNENLSPVDSFRIGLVEYLVNLRFGKIFVLRDDLSSLLLQEIYPSLNKVENYLRSYLIKNFTIREGVGYTTNQLFDNEQKNKTNKRKSNENIFSPLSPQNQEDLVDSKMYLVDFDDLGNIIRSSAFGNLKAEDIVLRITKATSLEELKKGVEAHSEKYFKKFQELGFFEKWESLKSIRHKVAHNGLVRLGEANKAKEILMEMTDFLEKESQEIIETPQDNVFQDFQDIEKDKHNLNIGFAEITRNTLISELKRYQRWSESLGRDFLGLKNFLYNIIGGKGYRIGGAWDILEELQQEGYIKIEEWTDPNGRFPTQKEIRIIKDLPVYTV